MTDLKAMLRNLGRLAAPGARPPVGVERGQGWVRVAVPGEATRAGSSLRDVVQERGLAGSDAAAMLEGSEVVVRRLTLPPMKGTDLRASIALECRNLVGYPVEEAVIRHEILGPSEQGNGVDVLVAVAPLRAVLEASRALEAAGLAPRRLTIRAVALRALLRATPGLDREEGVAYLEVGPRESTITIVRGDEIRFTRECGVGVAAFVDALRSIVVPGQGMRLLDVGEAEALLRRQGVLGTGDEAAAGDGIPGSAVLVMLRPSLERLVRELWNSIDYVHEQFQGQSVARVVLLGETARVPGLADHLAGVLKMPVREVDLESGMLGGGAVAGLPRLDAGSIDFLDAVGHGSLARVLQAVPARAAAAVLAVILLSISLPVTVTVQKERARVAELEAKLRGVEPYAEAVERFRVARTEEVRSESVIGALRGATPRWSEVLRDLSHRVGSEARIVSFTPVELKTDDPAAAAAAAPAGLDVRIEGLVRRERLRPEEPLGTLMASLARSPYVDRVALETCQAVSPAQSRFVLNASLRSGGTP